MLDPYVPPLRSIASHHFRRWMHIVRLRPCLWQIIIEVPKQVHTYRFYVRTSLREVDNFLFLKQETARRGIPCKIILSRIYRQSKICLSILLDFRHPFMKYSDTSTRSINVTWIPLFRKKGGKEHDLDQQRQRF